MTAERAQRRCASGPRGTAPSTCIAASSGRGSVRERSWGLRPIRITAGWSTRPERPARPPRVSSAIFRSVPPRAGRRRATGSMDQASDPDPAWGSPCTTSRRETRRPARASISWAAPIRACAGRRPLARGRVPYERGLPTVRLLFSDRPCESFAGPSSFCLPARLPARPRGSPGRGLPVTRGHDPG